MSISNLEYPNDYNLYAGSMTATNIQGIIGGLAGSIPNIVAGPAAGTSPNIAITGTQSGGVIVIGPGTGATTGILCTVTMPNAINSNYSVVICAANAIANADTSKFYVSTLNTTQWQLIATAALSAGQHFINYVVMN